jgi:hypothetical protein
VAHVAEERGLRAVELGERFRAAPFLLVGLGIRDAGGHLAAHELEEAAIRVVEPAEGIQPRDERAGAARRT